MDEKLLQFKKEQRDNRNKAKLEYVIGAALEGPQVRERERESMFLCFKRLSMTVAASVSVFLPVTVGVGVGGMNTADDLM